MDAFPRDTLVVAPTLDLVQQWHGALSRAYEGVVGLIGGGSHEIHPITVSTYDSAHIHMEHLGARFGMVIFDEASGIPDSIWSVAAGFFTENILDRYWFAFSNPRRNTGYFFECFHAKRDFWE